ncbi:MAG: ankyrin repeat domain-containing protein [Micavibrio sp.]|nr:ankyrin repeat domain-containing protein [Micavibrio sp.]
MSTPTPHDEKFFSAIAMGDPAAFAERLARPAWLEARNETGNTPLMVALIMKRLDFARQLIAAGSDVNAVGHQQRTPLHYALTFKQNDIAELLLARGADVNATWQQGSDALQTARSMNNPEGALLVMKHLPVERLQQEVAYVIRTDDMEALKMMVEKRGINLSEPDAEGRLPYDIAKAEGSLRMRHYLETREGLNAAATAARGTAKAVAPLKPLKFR